MQSIPSVNELVIIYFVFKECSSLIIVLTKQHCFEMLPSYISNISSLFKFFTVLSKSRAWTVKKYHGHSPNLTLNCLWLDLQNISINIVSLLTSYQFKCDFWNIRNLIQLAASSSFLISFDSIQSKIDVSNMNYIIDTTLSISS